MSASGPFGAWLADLARSVAQADPRFVGVCIVAAAGGAAFLTWIAWRSLYKARLIEDTPTSKARSAPQGYVELHGQGKLLDGAPIVAPLSGLPCVWYRFKVEERITSYYRGQAQHHWRTIDHGESTETFWLEDDTGRVIVDPEGADITPRHVDVWRSGSLETSSPLKSDFVARFVTNRPSANPYRFTEWRIDPGEPIFALGLLKNLGSYLNQTTVDEDVRQILHEWKKNQAQLLERFDLDKNGQIDEKEWMLARAQARRDALKVRAQQQSQFSEGLNLLGRTGDPSRPFILSAYPQRQIAQRYRWHAALFGAGFFALGITAVWLFNSRFG